MLLALLAGGLVAVGLIVREQSRHEREMDDLAEDIGLWARISELPPEDREHVRAMLREKWPEFFGKRSDDL